MSRTFRIGLALGGGGARGIAHLGVLTVLERAEITIDVIAGTSFGALAGAMYAVQPDLEVIQKRVTQFLHSPVFKKTRFEFMKQGYHEGKKAGFFSKIKNSVQRGIFYGVSFRRLAYISEMDYLEVMGELIPETDIEKTRIPLLMSAADLTTAREYVLEKGSLLRAVCATCALPGIFPPIPYGEHLLIDGGWVNPIPVDLARSRGADFVIAVDTSEALLEWKNLSNGLELLLRADTMARKQLTLAMTQRADAVIRPDVGLVHWADFSRPAEYIQKGMEAAEGKIQEIQQLIRKRKLRKLLLG